MVFISIKLLKLQLNGFIYMNNYLSNFIVDKSILIAIWILLIFMILMIRRTLNKCAGNVRSDTKHKFILIIVFLVF